MKKLLSFLVLLAVSGLANAAFMYPDPSSVFYGRFRVVDGVEVWTAPASPVTRASAGANSVRVWTAGASGGALLTETGAVGLKSGVDLALTAKRGATALALVKTAKGLLGGPLGIAMLTAPYVVEWLTKPDLRVALAPTIGLPVEIRDPTKCTVAPCYNYQFGGGSGLDVSSTLSGSAQLYADRAYNNNSDQYFNATVTSCNQSTLTCVLYGTRKPGYEQYGGNGPFNVQFSLGSTRTPDSGGWIPSTLDQAAPLLSNSNILIPPGLPQFFLDANGEIEVYPVAVEGPASSPVAPVVTSSVVAASPPVSNTSTASGNPFSLPNNTPTVTSTSNGSSPVPAGDGKTVNQPNTTTITSTYNPTTNNTTNVSNTVSDPVTITNTTNSTTNITYTTTNATAMTNNTTTTTITNNTNNSVINNTTTATTPKPAPDAKDTCGLPGTPACKLDETGTPTYDKTTMQLDKAKLDTDSQAQRTAIQGNADKGMFASWSSLFTLPALRACEPVALPTYVGVNLGSYDVCPGAEWVRGLMAWVWAVAGFAFVFKTVEGVI